MTNKTLNRWIAPLAAAAAGLLTLAAPQEAQAQRFFGALSSNFPDLNWMVIETDHFNVFYPVSKRTEEEGNLHYIDGEWLGRRTAQVAEDIYPKMCSQFDYYLSEKVNVVLLEMNDSLTGFTVPNFDWIVISGRDSDMLWRWRGEHDWINNVFTHEYAHVVSLKASNTWADNAFGWVLSGSWSDGALNTNAGFSMFFGSGEPWFWTEGGAEYYTQEAGVNVWSSNRDMFMRMDILQGTLLSWDDFQDYYGSNGGFDGERHYNAGYSFAIYLDERFGKGVSQAFAARRQEQGWTPDFTTVMEDVLQISAEELYEDWRAWAEAKYRRVESEVLAGGSMGQELLLTEPAWLSEDPETREDWENRRWRDRRRDRERSGRHNMYGRYSPDGRYYASFDLFRKITLRTIREEQWPAINGTWYDSEEDEEILEELGLTAGTEGFLGTEGQFDFHPDSNSIVVCYPEDTPRDNDFARHFGKNNADGWNWFQLGVLPIEYTAAVEGEGEDDEGEPAELELGYFQPVGEFADTSRCTDPAFSPDGSQIAYTRYDDGTRNIWIINADGTGAHAITDFDDGTRIENIDWSPDGSQLVFMAYRYDQADVYTINTDGSAMTALTFDKFQDRDPMWAADGKIYFASDRANNIFNIFAYDPAAGTGETDSDGDGFGDSVDQCATEPEDFNLFRDDDGCPDRLPVRLTEASLELLEELSFSGLDVTNADVLDQVAITLIQHPEIITLEVRADGTDDAAERAEALKAALVERGVAEPRLVVESDSRADVERVAFSVLEWDAELAPLVEEFLNTPINDKTLVEVDDGSGELHILDRVYFELGSSEIREVSHELLNAVATAMTSNEGIRRLEVAGHTDTTGADEDNMTLSRERAMAVRAYLVEQGVPALRLVARGYGESQLLIDSDSEEAGAANRRVEFNILRKDDEAEFVQNYGEAEVDGLVAFLQSHPDHRFQVVAESAGGSALGLRRATNFVNQLVEAGVSEEQVAAVGTRGDGTLFLRLAMDERFLTERPEPIAPAGEQLVRVSNVIGGAFTPWMTEQGNLFFAEYTAFGWKNWALAGDDLFYEPQDPAALAFAQDDAGIEDDQLDVGDWTAVTRRVRGGGRFQRPAGIVPILSIDNRSRSHFAVQGGFQLFGSDILTNVDYFFILLAGEALVTFGRVDWHGLWPNLFFGGGYQQFKYDYGFRIDEDEDASTVDDQFTGNIKGQTSFLFGFAGVTLPIHRKLEIGYTVFGSQIYLRGVTNGRELEPFYSRVNQQFDFAVSDFSSGAFGRGDFSINPRGGRRVSFSYGLNYTDILLNGGVDADDGAELDSYWYNQFEFRWIEYIAVPWARKARHTIQLDFDFGIIDRNVATADEFRGGGQSALNQRNPYSTNSSFSGYEGFSLAGETKLILNLAYRFPIVRDIDKRLGMLYLESIYAQVFGTVGNFWSYGIRDGAATKGHSSGDIIASDPNDVVREWPGSRASLNGQYILADIGAELRIRANLFNRSAWNSFIRLSYGFMEIGGVGDVDGDDIFTNVTDANSDNRSSERERGSLRFYIGIGTGW